MNEQKMINRILILLLIISALVRGVVAGLLEFGFDEVYYWTYARFPDLSHFDHPPMVGLMIQLFSLDLLLEHEFFIRLAAVATGTANTWIIFRIGSLIRNPRTGLYAAFLYTASFYSFVICGIFILPDAPQSLFWLLTLWFLLRALPDRECSKTSRNYLFFAGLTAGLAMLSKYHSAFLIFGAFMYIMMYNRKWLAIRETWYAVILILLLFLPVVFWNVNNDFITFTFHGSRTTAETGPLLRPEFLLVEIIGEFFYNNPVNVVVIILALIATFRNQLPLKPEYRNLILWISLPLLVTFWTLALFAPTLPHWTGPAYSGFILLAAVWLDRPKAKLLRQRLIPRPLLAALTLLVMLIILAVGQIRYGMLPLNRWTGRDFTHDMYGWKQLGEKFEPVLRFDRELMLMEPNAPILTFRWFPAANFEYYIGRKTGQHVYALGTLDRIHKYHWINRENGNLPIGSDAYYIALSDDFEKPEVALGDRYTTILPPDTIRIFRGNELVRLAYIYRLLGLKDELIFAPVDTIQPGNPEVERLLYFQKVIRSNPEWLRLLRKRAAQENASLEILIVLESRKMLDREREVRRDILKLDSLENDLSAFDSLEPAGRR